MSYLLPCTDLESCCTNNRGSGEETRPLILVVEDNDDNLTLMAFSLEVFGFACIGAGNAKRGLALASTYQPDLILLDIRMPDIDGIEFLLQLNQDEHLKNIPVIAVSAMAKSEDQDRVLAAGCVDYVTKPFLLDELETKIRRHLK